jgi:hypothetical protein
VGHGNEHRDSYVLSYGCGLQGVTLEMHTLWVFYVLVVNFDKIAREKTPSGLELDV